VERSACLYVDPRTSKTKFPQRATFRYHHNGPVSATLADALGGLSHDSSLIDLDLSPSIAMTQLDQRRIPIFLLKTKSVPVDTYEEHFAVLENGQYAPFFVPVLEHRFKQDALDQVRQHIVNGDFTSPDGGARPKYGALIFTSQRAVEAFTNIVEDIRGDSRHSLGLCLPENVPLYVVGPATARGLRALNLPNQILGEETGNGDALSLFILEHYNGLQPGAGKPGILFLVGEKRRDIIPNTLQSTGLPQDKRSEVHELVIYETGEMQSFQTDFSALWRKQADGGNLRQWVVVFSPQGCRAMLESLGLLGLTTGRALPQTPRDISIATIGPTTRDYLIREFDFTPDVCAEKPSPQGIAEAIRSFNARLG